jgi:hypothetical protein
MRWFLAVLAGVSLILAGKHIYLYWRESRTRDQRYRMLMEISLTIVLAYGAITWK